MKKLVLPVLLSALISTGCSTIINGDTQKLSAQATPSTATIRLLSSDGSLIKEQQGTLYHEIKRGSGYFSGASYTLEVSADCYKTQIVSIDSTLSGWYVGGNFLFGGLIGYLILDPATGGMWAMEASNSQDIETLKIVLIKDVSDELMKNAVPISNKEV